MMKRHAENLGNGRSKRLTMEQAVKLVLNDSEDDELDLDHGFSESDIEMESDDHLSDEMCESDDDHARFSPVPSPSGGPGYGMGV